MYGDALNVFPGALYSSESASRLQMIGGMALPYKFATDITESACMAHIHA